MAQNKAEYCHSRCPYFHIEIIRGTYVVNCAVIPQKMELNPDPREADDFVRDIHTNALIVLPVPCQAINPTLPGSPTVDLYKRKIDP